MQKLTKKIIKNQTEKMQKNFCVQNFYLLQLTYLTYF